MTKKTALKAKDASTKRKASSPVEFPPLEAVTAPYVDTDQAAHYLLRKATTLRIWACNEAGLVLPKRVGRRLFWPVADIRRVLGTA